ISATIARASDVWRQCGIEIVIENDELQTIAVPGLEVSVPVIPATASDQWTPEEESLMVHPSHALPTEGIITAYFVGQIGDGEQYGFAYPTTRYPAWRSGMLLVSDKALVGEAYLGTLAHEIGHILGLNHPLLDDGDPVNDTRENLMFTSEGVEGELDRVYGALTPLQCVVARAAPRFLHTPENEPLVPPPFSRSDRILLAGERVTGALTTRDAVTTDETEQFLDVYYLRGQEGDQITLDLTATAFDPYLLVDGPDGERLTQDDDSGEGWNVRVTLTLPQTGDYAIGVTSFARAVGAYELTVSAP
ncbi:MAG: hypothetical protein ACRDIB_13005, partial [Ardenticatenaceae bacterium]